MLDHDTDSYYKISRAFVDGQPAGNLTRDHVLDNITLYWLTGTGASAARSYLREPPTSSTSTRSPGGGHFAAWEEPELFSEEIRTAFRSLRRPD
jgi:pimeloyl-ACP methyl ester carboxylesterase